MSTPTTSPATGPARNDTATVGAHGPARERRDVRRWLALGLAVLVVAGLASAAPIGMRFLRDAQGQPPVIGASTIELIDNWFEPPVSQVPLGTAVTFRWAESVPHDVVFADGIGSPVQDAGTFTRHFDTPGSYPYRCTLHPFMEGRIDVVAQPASGR